MSNAPRPTLADWCGPTARSDEAIRAVEAELKLREQRPRRKRPRPRRCAPSWPPIPTTIRRAMTWRMALDAGGDRDGAHDRTAGIWCGATANGTRKPARKQLVTLFEAMGPTDPRTIEARRKLSAHPVFLMVSDDAGRYHSYRRPARSRCRCSR